MDQRLSAADLLAMPRVKFCEIFAGFCVALAKQKRAGIPSCERSNSTGVAGLTERLIVFHVGRRRCPRDEPAPVGRVVHEMRAGPPATWGPRPLLLREFAFILLETKIARVRPAYPGTEEGSVSAS